MDKLKPIEEGCLAVIVGGHPEYQGRTVTVGKYLGASCHDNYPDHWIISITGSNGHEMSGPEKALLRIDDYQQTKEQTKEKELQHG